MRKPFIAILTAFAGLAPLTAVAQQGGFAEADVNNDKKVTAVELKAYVGGKLTDFDRIDELLRELDKDKNGTLDAAEFENRMQAIRAVMSRPKPKVEAPQKPAVVEFADRYEKMFASRKPKVGDQIPDIIAFDERGKELSLSSTNGKYRVIVFGCLT